MTNLFLHLKPWKSVHTGLWRIGEREGILGNLDPSVVMLTSLDTLVTCYILHSPPPSYDPIVLKEYNEFIRNRASKQTSTPVAYGAQPNQPSNNAHIAQIEYDEFLQYHANKQTSPQVVSVA